MRFIRAVIFPLLLVAAASPALARFDYDDEDDEGVHHTEHGAFHHGAHEDMWGGDELEDEEDEDGELWDDDEDEEDDDDEHWDEHLGDAHHEAHHGDAYHHEIDDDAEEEEHHGATHHEHAGHEGAHNAALEWDDEEDEDEDEDEDGEWAWDDDEDFEVDSEEGHEAHHEDAKAWEKDDWEEPELENWEKELEKDNHQEHEAWEKMEKELEKPANSIHFEKLKGRLVHLIEQEVSSVHQALHELEQIEEEDTKKGHAPSEELIQQRTFLVGRGDELKATLQQVEKLNEHELSEEEKNTLVMMVEQQERALTAVHSEEEFRHEMEDQLKAEHRQLAAMHEMMKSYGKETTHLENKLKDDLDEAKVTKDRVNAALLQLKEAHKELSKVSHEFHKTKHSLAELKSSVHMEITIGALLLLVFGSALALSLIKWYRERSAAPSFKKSGYTRVGDVNGGVSMADVQRGMERGETVL